MLTDGMLTDIVMALSAAAFFLIVGIRLLRLSQRTGQTPERMLGVYFAVVGLAYIGWQLPVILEIEDTGGPIDLSAWALYCVGVVPFLLFVQMVFRPDASWAKGLVVGCVIALLVGMTMCIVQFHDYYRVDNPWYWSLWVGYTTPCAWMGIEAFLSWSKANRRVRIGLCDRVVANRYLLFGCFGAFQTFACVTDLFLTEGFTTNAGIATGLGLLLSALEIAGLVALFFAFFPPLFYQRWIAGPAPDSSATSEA